MSTSELFGDVREFPDPDAGDRFDALVGLDEIKKRLVSEAQVLVDPTVLEEWSNAFHGRLIQAVKSVTDRAPLVVLAGDVGTGKTELAENVGDPIAKALKVDVALYPLSLSARGKGLVGEMTTLLTQAFEAVRGGISGSRDSGGRVRRAAILLIDEADALAQSRELAQMHHEDRAGVNALIRGIDSLRKERLPVLVLMCTNRPDAIDPAVLRRAARVFQFSRPTEGFRRQILASDFDGAGLSEAVIDSLVALTGPSPDCPYGCTYSDLRQRFVPDAVLDALGTGPITEARLIELAEDFKPTRPFESSEE